MTMTFKIDYRSGIESSQEADTPINALRAEFADAGADFPEVESTFSGGDWDFAIYDAAEPQAPYSTSYFYIVKNGGAS